MNVDALSEVRIIVPVRNGGSRWRQSAEALRRYVGDAGKVVVIDSESSDGSAQVALDQGFELERIDVRSFNHGRTRQQAVLRYCAGCRIVVFLTQDAVLLDGKSLPRLVAAFDDPKVGAAYGRQLPHLDAQPFEAHAALFNYPVESRTKSLADAARLGIKAAWLSNSFAAYRIAALEQSGGFPASLIVGEDVYVAMRMILAGWFTRYCADACVRHSHDNTLVQELERYFDFGVMHAQMPELIARFGGAEGEGGRFVRSEFGYIAKAAPWRVPEVIVRNALKYAGYRLGRSYRHLPRAVCRQLSMTKRFWDPNLN